MMKTQLGDTNLLVSRIGLGTVKLGRNQGVKYPQPFELPSDNEVLNLLACAQDLGINLLDTAPAYGTSEERLGVLLQGQRHEWILATKAGEEFVNGESFYDFSKKNIQHSVERSLQRLKTDYLDIVLIHSNGDDKKIIEQDEALITLASLKKAGLIRAFGMSGKTIEGGILALDHSDLVMVTYNPIETTELPVITYAQQKNKGVFIKKAFASGHLNKFAADHKDPVKTAMQFIFQQPGVTSVILGTLSEDHLRHNVNAFQKRTDKETL